MVDARVIQRLNYPEYLINVDRAKAADLGLTQEEVMQNVIAAFNSSIQFNKKNFWIDPVSHNQYFVGVSYRPEDIESVETLLDIPITGPDQTQPGPAAEPGHASSKTNVPTEITHNNIQPTIDLTMGVEGRDLGHVADDVAEVVDEFGEPNERRAAPGRPYDPESTDGKTPMTGAEIVLSGEYERMRQTFRDLGIGLVLATLLIYFLMVGAVQVVRRAAGDPVRRAAGPDRRGADALPDRHGDQRAVAAGRDLHGRHHGVEHGAAGRLRPEPPKPRGLTPDEAIRKAASIRVRPVVMTALAAFFALVPTALALERAARPTRRWAGPSSAACWRAW